MVEKEKLTRFEKARIIGARALQVAMGAPVLVEVPEEVTDPIEIAKLEFKEDRIPITIIRPKPKKLGEK